MQKANAPVPGKTFDNRGIGLEANADVTQRKTGFRADGTFDATANSNDPNATVRRAQDPRLA